MGSGGARDVAQEADDYVAPQSLGRSGRRGPGWDWAAGLFTVAALLSTSIGKIHGEFRHVRRQVFQSPAVGVNSFAAVHESVAYPCSVTYPVVLSALAIGPSLVLRRPRRGRRIGYHPEPKVDGQSLRV